MNRTLIIERTIPTTPPRRWALIAEDGQLVITTDRHGEHEAAIRLRLADVEQLIADLRLIEGLGAPVGVP